MIDVNKNRILVGHRVIDEEGTTVREGGSMTITHENGTCVSGCRLKGEARKEQKKRLFAEFVEKLNG